MQIITINILPAVLAAPDGTLPSALYDFVTVDVAHELEFMAAKHSFEESHIKSPAPNRRFKLDAQNSARPLS
jgi:hypothetical protein